MRCEKIIWGSPPLKLKVDVSLPLSALLLDSCQHGVWQPSGLELDEILERIQTEFCLTPLHGPAEKAAHAFGPGEALSEAPGRLSGLCLCVSLGRLRGGSWDASGEVIDEVLGRIQTDFA